MTALDSESISVAIMIDWDCAIDEVVLGLQEVNFKEVSRIEKRGLIFGEIPEAQIEQLSSVNGVRWFKCTS